MKEGFITDDEILKELSKETDFSYSELKDIWIHQREYIKQMMEEEDVYSIFIPHIGTLCLNTKQARLEAKGKIKENYVDFFDKLDRLENHPNYTYYSNPHKKITGVNKLARNIHRNFETGIKRLKKLIPHKKCWDIIENHSNGKYEKRDENTM